MASIFYKWVLGKAVGKVDIGGVGEDPYFEEIPHEELGRFQRQGAKRKKALPEGISQNDAKVLKKVRSKAYQLDLAFQCCCGCQFGWAGIIALFPWIGDIIAAMLAYSLIKQARKIDGGLPSYLESQMIANLVFDFGIGLIPIVGDLINIAYKANSRNCLLLEEHLKKKSKPGFSFFGNNSSRNNTNNNNNNNISLQDKPQMNKKDQQKSFDSKMTQDGSSFGRPPPPPPQAAVGTKNRH